MLWKFLFFGFMGLEDLVSVKVRYVKLNFLNFDLKWLEELIKFGSKNGFLEKVNKIVFEVVKWFS